MTNIVANDKLSLPEPNTFIAENFDVVKPAEKVEPVICPSIVTETDKIRLWHKKDDTFYIPEVRISKSSSSNHPMSI
jgi:insulysin